jgi:hypothetical protein
MLPYYLIIGGILTICLIAGRVITIMVRQIINSNITLSFGIIIIVYIIAGRDMTITVV